MAKRKKGLALKILKQIFVNIVIYLSFIMGPVYVICAFLNRDITFFTYNLVGVLLLVFSIKSQIYFKKDNLKKSLLFAFLAFLTLAAAGASYLI